MPLTMPVKKGMVLWCDFTTGFEEPEMVKRRLVVVLSPHFKDRPRLATVVALSLKEPFPRMPYHAPIDISPPLPPPLVSRGVWVKGDMVYSVSYKRLDFATEEETGEAYTDMLSDSVMKVVQGCVLQGLGLGQVIRFL